MDRGAQQRKLRAAIRDLKCVHELKRHFDQTCAAVIGGRKAHAHFEQWLWAARSSAAKNGQPIPVVPSPVATIAEDELTRKLERAGLTITEAKRVSSQLTAFAHKLVARDDAKLDDSGRNSSAPIVVVAQGSSSAGGEMEPPCGLVTLCCCDTRVIISKDHLEKLRSMHAANADTDECILADAYCTLARVSALQGGDPRAGGMQAACVPAVFDLLSSELGVELELFASPLNCNFRYFCSAAYDVDAPFGSIGSFHSSNLDEQFSSGAYFANPPYEAGAVSAATNRIEELIVKAEATGKELTFLVVLPHWPDKLCWKNLTSSSHATAVLTLPQSMHGFCEGGQHYRPTLWRRSNHDTSVVVLQSLRAAKRSPFTPRLERELRIAFNTPPSGCARVPTVATKPLMVVEELGDRKGEDKTRKRKRKRQRGRRRTS